MNILALDTATEACSAALMVNGAVLARYDVAGRSHTEKMIPMVRELLSDAGIGFAQLDAYVCGIGPGSFAGVRIGLGFMKGLSLAHDRPAVGVSSLAAMALPALRAGAVRVLSVIDARMNEVYVGAYAADGQGLPRLLVPEQVCAPTALAHCAGDGWQGVGSGWGSHEAALRASSGLLQVPLQAQALPHAEDALCIGAPQLARGEGGPLDLMVPVYLRNKVALTLKEQQANRAR